jgi:hypothetical protein
MSWDVAADSGFGFMMPLRPMLSAQSVGVVAVLSTLEGVTSKVAAGVRRLCNEPNRPLKACPTASSQVVRRHSREVTDPPPPWGQELMLGPQNLSGNPSWIVKRGERAVL